MLPILLETRSIKIAQIDKQPMDLHFKKRSLDEAGRNSILKSAAEFLADRYPEILAAYVFGSFPREQTFGDLDIAVLLVTSPAEPLKFELTLEGDLEKSVHIPVDIRVLNRAPQPFQYNVIREGQLMLDRDPNRRAAFEGNVVKQYLDFSRFRRRSIREIAIAEF
jgi:predicted nucleotidyltransferase